MMRDLVDDLIDWVFDRLFIRGGQYSWGEPISTWRELRARDRYYRS